MDLPLNLYLLVFLSYFLGGAPSGKWIAGLKGVSITEIGSGNIGAANVCRALGTRLAITVLTLDAIKGFLPTFLARIVFHEDWIVCCVALAAFIGNIFSPFMGLKGGKGASTYFGILLAIVPIPAVVGFLIWLLTVKVVKITSIVNLVIFLFSVPVIYLFSGTCYAFFGSIIWGLIIYTHRDNIKRILKGKELTVCDQF